MSSGSTRDMERARAILAALFEEAVEAVLSKAHKPHWVGIGLRKGADSIIEEAHETCDAIAQVDHNKPDTVLHARREGGQMVWSIAMTLDDSGVFGDVLGEKESVA